MVPRLLFMREYSEAYKDYLTEDNLSWAFVILVVLGAMFIRLRLLSIPLERDEGEYAYMAQLILRGIPPYIKAYSMKFPGIYFVYAAIMTLFGQTIEGIHLGLILVNAATIILLFLLGKRFFRPYAAVTVSASFALLALGGSVLGLTANAEHFLLLPVAAGLLIMLKALDRKNLWALFLSGLCFGSAFIIKQPAFFFAAMAIIYIFWRPQRIKRVLLFSAGFTMPLAATFFYLYVLKAFAKFWFCTVTYAHVYTSLVKLPEGLKNLFFKTSDATNSGWALWIIAAAGFISLFRKKIAPDKRMFLLLFSIASMLAVMPGLYFRRHYYILAIPAASLLIGFVIDDFKRFLPRLKFSLFIIVFVCLVLQESLFLFKATPLEACRMMYPTNPFPEAVEIAKYIKVHSNRDSTLAVLGSEPEIYFYSKRDSATPCIYMYPLMEPHRYAMDMQDEFIRGMESSLPEYIIFVNTTLSWTDRYVSARLQKHIFGWFEKFKDRYYDIAGVVEMVFDKNTKYLWGREAQIYEPQSGSFIYIFKKR